MLEIEVPDAPAANGGLLSVIPAQSGVAGLFYEGVRYRSIDCGHNRPVPEYPNPKTFDDVPYVEGTKFQIYRGIEASLFEHEQAYADARAAFNRGESWAVERGVQETLLNGAATVDITPVAGTPVTDRLLVTGMLEQYAADLYGARPLIHTNKLGTALLDPEVGDGGALTTKQGTPVINGGGYGPVGPGGATAPARSAWVYVTGNMHLWRQLLDGDTQGYALKENRTHALVEATYLATAECFVAAILVGK